LNKLREAHNSKKTPEQKIGLPVPNMAARDVPTLHKNVKVPMEPLRESTNGIERLPAGCSADDVSALLRKILASSTFARTRRARDFLSHVVSCFLQGKSNELKEYSIALAVFGKNESFDPSTSPLVRVEAARLRARMSRYLETEGRSDRLLIELPKGCYVPIVITRAQDVQRLGVIGTGANVRSRIGVLPLVALDGNKTARYADACTEALIDALSHVPDLYVCSRISILQFKEAMVGAQQIGEQLGVGSLIEGSVLRGRSRIRMKLRLIDSSTGFSRPIGTFECRVKNCFGQEDIFDSIAVAVKRSLAGQMDMCSGQ
jgi:TolB-like protein